MLSHSLDVIKTVTTFYWTDGWLEKSQLKTLFKDQPFIFLLYKNSPWLFKYKFYTCFDKRLIKILTDGLFGFFSPKMVKFRMFCHYIKQLSIMLNLKLKKNNVVIFLILVKLQKLYNFVSYLFMNWTEQALKSGFPLSHLLSSPGKYIVGC